MAKRSSADLLDILAELNEIPFACATREEALKRVTMLGRRALRSRACTLTFVDFEQRYLTQEACDGPSEEFERSMVGRQFEIGTNGHMIDYELAGRGQPVERYGLEKDGGGIANPKVAAQYGLRAALCHPLRLDDQQVIGYINHFSDRASQVRPFTSKEKRTIQILARQATIAIGHFEARRFQDSARVLNRLSEGLLSVTLQECFGLIADAARELLSVPVCVMWTRDENAHTLKIVEMSGTEDPEYRRIELDCDAPNVREYLSRHRVATLADVRRPHKWYQHANEARARNWVTLLTAQMRVGHSLVGMLDVYTTSPRAFKEWEKQSFGAFANHAALFVGNFASRRRLQDLNHVQREMTTASDVDEVLAMVLDRGLSLVRASRGWVSRLNHQTGVLQMVKHSGAPRNLRDLTLGEGITGLALREGTVQNVGDVQGGKHRGVYQEFWSDTVSELAVPILLETAAVRVGHHVRLASRPFGVLNIESPQANAFSAEDVEIVQSLARQAAIIIERLEVDRKIAELARVERDMVSTRGYNALIRQLSTTVMGSLGYEYVNVSEVTPGRDRIKTTHVAGIHAHRVAEFKRLADHALGGDDIQAHIVRMAEAEVPGRDDSRFDSVMEERFGHKEFTRVFVPMRVLPTNTVIGTVEAGYKRHVLPHIYERDVQLLQGFVDYVALVLEQQRGLLLDPISHEFRAPIVGIRSHAAFLREWMPTLPPDVVERKLDDILTDSELLLLQVGELEHILGRPAPVSRPTRTVVMRDVVIKAIKQFQPVVLEHGYDPRRISYDRNDVGKMILYIDRTKLSQVFSNLFLNAIRYAQDPQSFAIRFQVDETRDRFIIKFKDWGMGIKAGLEEAVFEERFRSPEAIKRLVTGTGLGLAISRRILRDMGGDLLLRSIFKPTEFHVILPKTLKEAPRDSDDR
jgi:signal transduction histidine kinase/GAF domain-containing protein